MDESDAWVERIKAAGDVSRAEHATLRVEFLAAALNLAANERSDSLTEIDEISARLTERLWPRPTRDEWQAAFKVARIFQREYPDEEPGPPANPRPGF